MTVRNAVKDISSWKGELLIHYWPMKIDKYVGPALLSAKLTLNAKQRDHSCSKARMSKSIGSECAGSVQWIEVGKEREDSRKIRGAYCCKICLS